MSSGGVIMESPNNRNEANKRLSCSFYGCKRVYTDESSLQSHVKDHEIPAQSLPGKTMMCSTIGCSCSFPNMQKLMEHLRHHHKPNVYFLCESCHAKLRSYRGLLHHLRSCSKAPKPKINHILSPSASSTPPAPMDVDPAKPTAPAPQDNLSPPPQLPPVLTQSNNTPVVSPNLELTPPHLIQQIIDSTVNAMFSKESPQALPNPETQAKAISPEAQVHQGPKMPENSGPQNISPQTPPANIWKSGQGTPPEKRILWQHTRGRYTCVQCGHSVTNRKEMTEHSAHHNTVRSKEETNNSTATST